MDQENAEPFLALAGSHIVKGMWCERCSTLGEVGSSDHSSVEGFKRYLLSVTQGRLYGRTDLQQPKCHLCFIDLLATLVLIKIENLNIVGLYVWQINYRYYVIGN